MLTTYTERHVPLRTCVGCRRRAAQSELVRCVLGQDGRAVVSRTAPGRGAWLCGPECLRAAIARRGFDRAWRVRVTPEALTPLVQQLGAEPGERHVQPGTGALDRQRHEMRDLKTEAKG